MSRRSEIGARGVIARALAAAALTAAGSPALASLILCGLAPGPARAAAQGTEVARGEVWSVVEIPFEGPHLGPADCPARDVELCVALRHESGSPEHAIQGFWDGDGRGGLEGRVFKVRFSPTRPGRWEIVRVRSNSPELDGQKEGSRVVALPSRRPGFWIADPESPGRRWYARSDGSHESIVGNTHYSFLSGRKRGGEPTGTDIAADVARNAKYFKKLRFGLSGDYYPDPAEKPFLDDAGRPTDSGDHSHRPNPRWFGGRVDAAVRAAFERDLIADLILAGPDTEEARATLRAAGNGGDPTPFLRYIAARYGSFPNVWICLANEFDIRTPRYGVEEIARFGRTIRGFLPYPTPLSVHGTPGILWPRAFDEAPPWHDHQTIQRKLRSLAEAADAIREVSENPGGRPREKPTVNDELSYQGAGDGHSEADTVEAHLGAFLGGGYGTTGEKSGPKIGPYFWGGFDPAAHTAAESLRWLRETIDAQIAFWKMAPDRSIFSNLDPSSRGLSWPGREYALGTSGARKGIVAELPQGVWTVTLHDAIARRSATLAEGASGRFAFDAPESRAALFHFRRRAPAASLRLLERRVDARERTEAEVDLPPGCVVTGLGARADVDNLTTLHVEYREILEDGSLGPRRELRAGSDPEHATEAEVSLPDGWIAVGFGARGAPEWDVATLRVWGRRWRREGDDGAVRAWSDGREPEAGLERSVLVDEPDRVLVGVGLRFHQNDIQGIYARSARVVEAPAGGAHGAVGEARLRVRAPGDGVPRLRLRPPELGPVPIAALDADRLQAEILGLWRRGVREVSLDAEGVRGTAAEPLLRVAERLLEDPFRPAEEALREAIAERVGEALAERALRAAGRAPLAARFAFAAAGRPFLGARGMPRPEELPEMPGDRRSAEALAGERDAARWLLEQSAAEVEALLRERDAPWLAAVRSELEDLALAVDAFERLARAEILSRVYLADGAAATREEARAALAGLEVLGWREAFGDPGPLREAIERRLAVAPEDTGLGRELARIGAVARSGDPRDAERAAEMLAEALGSEALRPHLRGHWKTVGDLATSIGAFGHDAASVRVLWGGDGRWHPEKRSGRWAFARTREGPCVYLDALGNPSRAALAFEYFDDRPGEIHVQYNSLNPETGEREDYRSAAVVRREGTGGWKTAEVPLERCAFRGGQNLGADLRLIASEDGAALRAPRIEAR